MKEKEYISEAHRQRRLLEERKTKNLIMSILASLIISVGFYMIFKSLLYTSEDRKVLETISQYRKQARKEIKDPKKLREYLEYLKREEEKVKSKYPFPTLWFIGKYPGNKLVFLVASLLPAVAMVGVHLYLKRKVFPKWDNFFLPTIKQEEVIKLPNKTSRLWGERYKDVEDKFIKDVDTVKRLFASLDIKEMEEAEKLITELIKESYKFLKEYFPYEKHKEVLFCIEFLLFHHLASLYGNLPTSLLGKYVKDYNLRKALSLYQRNHLPVITGIDGKLLQNEEQAFILCKIFYTLDKHLNLRRRIDERFDPLRMG